MKFSRFEITLFLIFSGFISLMMWLFSMMMIEDMYSIGILPWIIIVNAVLVFLWLVFKKLTEPMDIDKLVKKYPKK